MSHRPLLLCACLLSLGLPAPLGLLLPLGVRALGVPAAAARALAPFGAAALVAELDARRAPPADVPPQGRRLTGVLRQPRLDTHALLVDGRPLPLRLADDLPRPPPGTPVQVLARLDARGRVRVVDLTVLGPPRGAWIERWRALARQRVETLSWGAGRGLVAALVLGDRSDLPDPLWRQARRTGTVHLLALSGLHVGLAAWWLGRLLACAGLPGEHPRLLALLAFVALAGAGPPLLRALVGWCLLTWGRLRGRSDGGLARLGAVALLLVCWQPGLVDHLGARLSLLAVAGLLVLPGPAWAAPVGAVLVTAPLCAEVFGEVAWVGVLLTPLLLPLVAALLAVGLVSIVTGELFAAADPLWSLVLQSLADAFLGAEEQLARWAPDPLRPPAPPLPAVVLSVALVVALWICQRALRQRRLARLAARRHATRRALPIASSTGSR